ncbi:MAG TPA: TolC family protein [Pirellulales bacterium]
MNRRFLLPCLLLASQAAGLTGCYTRKEPILYDPSKTVHYKTVATQIEYPDVATASKPEALGTLPPRLIHDGPPERYQPLPLQDAVRIALTNSQVMRDLGGRLLTQPGTTNTIYEPSIRESDPRFGVEAALSAFDTNIASSMFWARNDRPVNNNFGGNVARILEQDTGNFNFELNKRAATGTLFTARHLVNYDYNNSPNNLFPSVWDVQTEAEIRQPLLQGAGLMFNRAAGPQATPGFLGTSGVLVARINTDIALADFEIGVRNLISDVENAYWELYFAYRDLDARIAGRNASLETWRKVNALFIANRTGGEADKEAQAREQYYLFEAQTQNALAGTPGRGTLSGNGSTGGVFQGAGGVYASERRLRVLMGLSATDDVLLRPDDEPLTARLVLNWDEVLPEALTRREELRRQKWTVKRRELELLASKNFLLPRLDAVGLYRWRGFGDDLYNSSGNAPQFDNAYQNLFDGDFQEWQLGWQFNYTIGGRQAWAAVRNAELLLTRDRAVLRDQELMISHDLSNAVAELDRAYVLSQTTFNRRVAAQQQLAAVEVTYEKGTATLDLLLDAQRRVAEADVAYYRALVEYAIAMKNIQLEKGSLLEFNGVYLNEGPWNPKAYQDAFNLSQRMRPARIDYWNPKLGGYARPGLVSQGQYSQHVLNGDTVLVEPTEAPAALPGSGVEIEEGLEDAPAPPPAVEDSAGNPFGGPEFNQSAGFSDDAPQDFSTSRRSPVPVNDTLFESPYGTEPSASLPSGASAPAKSTAKAPASESGDVLPVEFQTPAPPRTRSASQPAPAGFQKLNY